MYSFFGRKTVLLGILLLSACNLSPDRQVPEMTGPSVFKEAGPDKPLPAGLWRAAAPQEKNDRGEWWAVFNDEMLTALAAEARENNQTLKIALAHVEEARALARAARVGFFPNINLGANAARQWPSGAQAGFPAEPYTLYDAGGSASYEPDLFGRVRGAERAAWKDAAAEEAAFRSVLLALQADVAQNYFSLRALDSEIALLRRAVEVRGEGARIMRRRHTEGFSDARDLARAEADFANVESELAAVRLQRAAGEHALAVLLGKNPSAYSFAEAPLEDNPPKIAAGIPSTVLSRRPDLAGALARMAAANERIGAARAAFFPSFSLTASGGYESSTLGDLFQWSARTWALGQMGGALISLPLLDSGRRMARTDAAHAAYEGALAAYRQTALTAFREVEDSLAAERLMAEQATALSRSSKAAREALRLTDLRYKEGDVDYFELVDASRTALAAERALVQLRGRRHTGAITLVRALGGGWD